MSKVTSSSTKSPYEIRLELLKMAQEQLQSAYQLQVEFANKAFELTTDTAHKTVEQFKAMMPAAYSVEDIIKKANELYGFVQKKD